MTDRAPPRHMHLGVFVQTPGHHGAGWRHPDATADGWPNLALMKHIAATAEAAKFDMFFLGDGFATGYGEHPSTIGKFEPLTLLSALAMTTSRLGLAATGSTTDAEPYHVARSFASLVPAPPTASTSCRPSSPASSTISPGWWCRSCRNVACSAPTMRGRRCATISA